MYEEIKKRVYKANIELVEKGLVIYTWGNVSEIDRKNDVVVIKPSGLDYKTMKSEDMVVVDLFSGKVVDGTLRPSSDTPTHLEIYRAFPQIGGITHTHSVNAVAFAQAGLPIKVLGTTHADYFYGEIPCTRPLTKEEVMTDYELNTGKVIVETFKKNKKDVIAVPGVLVNGHGPFSWGKSAGESVYHSVVLDTIAEMALKTQQLNPNAELNEYVLNKHYQRKHGKNAYYGQK